MMAKNVYKVFATAVLVAGLCIGCGQSAPELVQFGAASPERRAEFIGAVEGALKGFDGFKDQKATVGKIDDGGRETIAIRSDGANPMELERAVAVVITNVALKYRGVGFMKMGEGAWKVLIPDDTPIPVSGDFGLNIQ